MQAERRADTDGDRDAIIAKELDPPADDLTAQAAQDTVTVCGESVEELEGSAQRQDTGDKGDDIRVGGEELGDIVAEGGEEDDVEEADGDGDNGGDFGGRFGGRGEGGADEVGDAGAGGDGDGEGDLEGQACKGGEHGLRGQVGRAEVGGR